jgi:hypothetical protein
MPPHFHYTLKLNLDQGAAMPDPDAVRPAEELIGDALSGEVGWSKIVDASASYDLKS